MPLIPEFHPGFCNVWLGSAPFILIAVLTAVLKKEAAKRAADISTFTKKEKGFAVVSTVFFYLCLLYSVFVPLKTGTGWFWAGAAAYLPGLVCLGTAYANYAFAPLDQPVRHGVYRLSRNPIYFFSGVMVLGMGLAGASWVILLLGVAYNVLNHRVILAEEKFCLEKYGKAYAQYMEKTPRYFPGF